MVESVEEARLAVSQRGIEGTRQQGIKANFYHHLSFIAHHL
jgi:hypothetical protein